MHYEDFIKSWILPRFELPVFDKVEFKESGGQEDAEWLVCVINNKSYILGIHSMGGILVSKNVEKDILAIEADCEMLDDKPPLKSAKIVKVKKQFRTNSTNYICELTDIELHQTVQQHEGQIEYNSILTKGKKFKYSTIPYSSEYVLFET